MIYFAYGSNMSAATMEKRAPNAKKLGMARLADHRLAFTRRSVRWNAGVADAREYTGLSVFGVAYALDDESLAILDKKEGAPRAYRRTNVEILLDHEPIQAVMYVVTDPASTEIPPHVDYLAQMIQAAQDCGLPKSYIEFLHYIQGQFSGGTRDNGLLLCPTFDRGRSAGEPVMRLNPEDSGNRSSRYAAMLLDRKCTLGKADVAMSVPLGECQADQALRVCVGLSGQFCFGHRITVLPSSGSLPSWSPIKPRALALPLHPVSRNDGEKNYCVLHPDRIRIRKHSAPCWRDGLVSITGRGVVSVW
jgi:gamma-glutamylcyclotransferase